MVFDGITWIHTTHRILRHTGQDIGAQELDIDTCHFENQSTDVVRQIDFFMVVPCCTLRLVVIVGHGVDSENALRNRLPTLTSWDSENRDPRPRRILCDVGKHVFANTDVIDAESSESTGFIDTIAIRLEAERDRDFSTG